MQTLMETLSVVMTRDVKKIHSTATVTQAAARMQEERVGSLLIEDQGEVIGIVTETDVVRKAAAKGVVMQEVNIGEIMSKPLVTIQDTNTPQNAHDMMWQCGIRHLVVTKGTRIVGIVSMRDLLIFYMKLSEPQMGID